MNQLFNLRLFVGVVIIENRYLYLLAGIFLALAFAAFPISPRARGGPTPWYDLILAALSLGACGYFTFTAHRSLMEGWEYAAPPLAMAMSFLLWAPDHRGHASHRRPGDRGDRLLLFRSTRSSPMPCPGRSRVSRSPSMIPSPIT